MQNDNVLLPEQTDSIRTIAIRTGLIKAAEHYNNRGNEKVLSKEQLTSNNETNADAIGRTSTNTDMANKNDLKMEKRRVQI